MLNNIVSYLVEPHKFNNIVFTLPDIVPSEYVRVKYEYCGICGGDYSRFLGYRNDYPISLGHEFVAKILDINCNKELSYSIGDHVISDFNYRCGKCSFCMEGNTHLCLKNDVEFFTNRAFSQYADIHYSYLVKTNVPNKYLYRATVIEPLSCIIHAMNHYDMSKINFVLVYGTGNIGMLCVFFLSFCMKKNVQLFDTNTAKQEYITNTFSCMPTDFNTSYDLVIEATNSSLGLEKCIELFASTKNICSFSHLYGQATDKLYDKLVRKECSIYFPLRNGSRKNLNIASEIIEQKWENSFDKLIHIYETNNINFPFEDKSKCNKPKQVIKFISEQ